MKKQLISSLCCGLVSILFVSNSFAQAFNLNQLEPVFITGTKTAVTENIQVNFHKQFPEAENVRWFKHDKNYLVTFLMEDQNQRALLTRKGHLIYQISYGKERHLPVDIRKDVKRMYIEHSISSAIKVQEANRTIWVISVEDNTNMVFVRVENNEIEEVRKYKKYTPQSKPHIGIEKTID